MGVYYEAVCQGRKEVIDPAYIDDLGCKIGAISSPEHPFGAMVVFAMSGRWRDHPVLILGDYEHDEQYTDVTNDIIVAYNETYGTNHRYTGPRHLIRKRD